MSSFFQKQMHQVGEKFCFTNWLKKHRNGKNRYNIDQTSKEGPSFSREIYVELKTKMFSLEIIFLTKSPEQYNGEFNAEKEFRKTSEYEAGLVFFDDMLENSQKQLINFYERKTRRLGYLLNLSESCFCLPKRTIGNGNSIIILFKQALKMWRIIEILVVLI